MSSNLNIQPNSGKGKMEFSPDAPVSNILLLDGNFIEQPWLTFTSEASSGDGAFDPVVVTSSGTVEWDLGDGSIINSNSFSHDYVNDAPKTVKLYSGSVPAKDNITTISFFNDEISGELDLSEFTYLNTANLRTNPNLTSVITPIATDTAISEFRVDDCDITGFLDLSGYGGMSGQLYANNNSNLTSITLPDSSGTFIYITLSNTGISSVDFTPFTTLCNGGGISLNGCTNLTSMLFPDVSGQTSTYISGLSSFTGSLDVSSLTGLYQFLCQNNYTMTDIIMPEVIADMNVINVFRAGLTGTWDLSMLGTHFPTNFTGNLCPSLNGLIIPTSSNLVTTFNFSNCDLTGTLDVSGLTGLGGNLTLYGNDNLTKILNPTSSGTFSDYQVQSCDLTGTLDVSGLTGLGGVFNASNNGNLTNILLPSSSQVFTYFLGYSCNLTGTLDLSMLTGLGNVIQLHGNSDLTEVSFPTSSQNIVELNLGSCDFTSLDMSSFSNLSGSIYSNSNSNLISVTLPTINNEFSSLFFTDCSLNLSSVDAIYNKLNTFYSSNTPTKALTVGTGGGNSSPPTDGSSNSDILNLESIFSIAGETLTITINE